MRRSKRWMLAFTAGLATAWLAPTLAGAAQAQNFDLGIESMRSHAYSVGIFIFMMIAMAVFVGIIIGYMRTHQASEMKPGEKAMFVAIVLGVVLAAVFAAVQLLDGFLF
ncbi:MAG: hypothetical protein R8K47_06490 [Mariprofundaceae bacterium]